MGFHLRRPGETHLDRLLARCKGHELTYEPRGVSLAGKPTERLRHHCWTSDLPREATFERARRGLETWAIPRGAGLSVRTDGPLAEGTNVAMCAPLPIGFVDVTCRIVVVVDEPHRFGFAYGTLPVHPEAGEESFIVHRTPLRFVVQAASRPAHALARMAPPIADRLQEAATRRYLKAMSTASTS